MSPLIFGSNPSPDSSYEPEPPWRRSALFECSFCICVLLTRWVGAYAAVVVVVDDDDDDDDVQ